MFTAAFMFGAFIAGMSGVVGAGILFLQPGQDFEILLFALVVVIIGGLGSLEGAALGAAVVGLIDAFATIPGVMPHIHLPVQAGANRVLETMNRRYTVEHYLGLVERLRETRPDIAITSDMIVGFPGETDAEFESTLDLMRRVVFDGLFSFKFSPRPGTRAAELPDPVAEGLKEERLARL